MLCLEEDSGLTGWVNLNPIITSAESRSVFNTYFKNAVTLLAVIIITWLPKG